MELCKEDYFVQIKPRVSAQQSYFPGRTGFQEDKKPVLGGQSRGVAGEVLGGAPALRGLAPLCQHWVEAGTLACNPSPSCLPAPALTLRLHSLAECRSQQEARCNQALTELMCGHPGARCPL